MMRPGADGLTVLGEISISKMQSMIYEVMVGTIYGGSD